MRRGTQSGDLNALTQFLASDVRVVMDGGGEVRAALNVIDGADRVAQFLVDVTLKRLGAWWREDFTLRVGTINGLPRLIVGASEGPVQTTAFESRSELGGLLGARCTPICNHPQRIRRGIVLPGESSLHRPSRAPGFTNGAA
jgi:hypothetical protein